MPGQHPAESTLQQIGCKGETQGLPVLMQSWQAHRLENHPIAGTWQHESQRILLHTFKQLRLLPGESQVPCGSCTQDSLSLSLFFFYKQAIADNKTMKNSDVIASSNGGADGACC